MSVPQRLRAMYDRVVLLTGTPHRTKCEFDSVRYSARCEPTRLKVLGVVAVVVVVVVV